MGQISDLICNKIADSVTNTIKLLTPVSTLTGQSWSTVSKYGLLWCKSLTSSVLHNMAEQRDVPCFLQCHWPKLVMAAVCAYKLHRLKWRFS